MIRRSAVSWSFQSTRPRGARHDDDSDHSAGGGVSIHAPAWGATHWLRSVPPSNAVSIHAPAWGATRQVFRDRHAARVSIHAPAWGATDVYARPRPPRGSFNPRARVGRDVRPRHRCRDWRVSIHAPAWGATSNADESASLATVFQSTRPRGARHDAAGKAVENAAVSIHAPAWGATGHAHNRATRYVEFQSTRPRGARQGRYGAAGWPACFNPRARVGRDVIVRTRATGGLTFQSTRPRGARLGKS